MINKNIIKKNELKNVTNNPKGGNRLIKAKHFVINIKIKILIASFLLLLNIPEIYFKVKTIYNIQKQHLKKKELLMNFLISSNLIKIKGAKMPENYSSWFNPSIINYSSIFLITMRDTNNHYCSKKIKNITTIKNKIIFGVGDSIYNLTYAGMIDNLNLSNPKLQGLEDARLFTYDIDNKIGMLTTNNFEMYISRLKLSINEKYKYTIKEIKRHKIKHSLVIKKRGQKNWVRFPNEKPGEDPQFICYLNPLIIVSINVESGIPNLIFKGNKKKNIIFEIRGNTNFIKILNEIFLGICHIIIHGHYYSIFMTIKRIKNAYKIESFSKYFKFPIFDENKLITDQYRIHFPLSLLCYDNLKCSSILISLGIMDCQPYFALYNKSFIINNLLKRKI